MPPLVRTPPKRNHHRRPEGSFPSPDDYDNDELHVDPLGSFPAGALNRRRRSRRKQQFLPPSSSSSPEKKRSLGSAILHATLKFLNRFRRQRPVTHHPKKKKNKQQHQQQHESSIETHPTSFWKRRKLFHSSSCHWEKLDAVASGVTRTGAVAATRRNATTTEQEQEMLLPSILMTPVGTGQGNE